VLWLVSGLAEFRTAVYRSAMIVFMWYGTKTKETQKCWMGWMDCLNMVGLLW